MSNGDRNDDELTTMFEDWVSNRFFEAFRQPGEEQDHGPVITESLLLRSRDAILGFDQPSTSVARLREAGRRRFLTRAWGSTYFIPSILGELESYLGPSFTEPGRSVLP